MINENWIQLKGKIIPPETPDREHNVILSGEFAHAKYEEKPNEDGTYDAIYTLLPLRVLIQTGDKKTPAKVKSRGSQRLRAALWHVYQSQERSESFDEFYENTINKIMLHLEEILKFI